MDCHDLRFASVSQGREGTIQTWYTIGFDCACVVFITFGVYWTYGGAPKVHPCAFGLIITVGALYCGRM